MNQFTFDGSWNQIKGKLREKFAELTDDDLQFVQGKGEELFGRLQSRLGVGADELNKLLNDLSREVEEAAGAVHGRFESAKHNVSEAARDVKARAAEFAGDLKAGAVKQAEHFKEKAEEVYEDARHKVHTWRDQGEGYVREQPRTALLAALVAGFVLGLVVRR